MRSRAARGERSVTGGTFFDERAVSKVIGVVLMVAIVVALAATVGFMVVGFGDMLNEPAPQVAFEATYYDEVDDPDEFHPDLPSNTNEVVVLSHGVGDQFDPSEVEYVIYRNGDEQFRAFWDESDHGQEEIVSSSDALYPHAYGGETLSDMSIRIIWHNPQSDSSQIIYEWDGPEAG